MTPAPGSPHLFRGINAAMFEATGSRLIPKSVGPFEYTFLADGTIRADGSATYGPSEQNAVLRHELEQKGWPTAGISTTPHFEQARGYATAGGTCPGVVLRIDRLLAAQLQVKEYVVADWIPHPSVPEDAEVILVAHDCGELPAAIVIEAIQVELPNQRL